MTSLRREQKEEGYTPHGATSALDASRAGRHLWRPYGGRIKSPAYDANMTDGTREVIVRAKRDKNNVRAQSEDSEGLNRLMAEPATRQKRNKTKQNKRLEE